jgi:hypothetical protein
LNVRGVRLVSSLALGAEFLSVRRDDRDRRCAYCCCNGGAYQSAKDMAAANNRIETVAHYAYLAERESSARPSQASRG